MRRLHAWHFVAFLWFCLLMISCDDSEANPDTGEYPAGFAIGGGVTPFREMTITQIGIGGVLETEVRVAKPQAVWGRIFLAIGGGSTVVISATRTWSDMSARGEEIGLSPPRGLFEVEENITSVSVEFKFYGGGKR